MYPIDWIYVALATVFALVMIYMFTYNIKMRRRENALKQSEGAIVGKSANIARTVRSKEDSQSHTLN